MSTVRRIAKNTGFLFIGDIIVRLLGLLLIVYLARNFGAAEYGKYAFAVAFTSLFLILADIGLGVISTRDIARDTRKAGIYLTTISLLKLTLAVIVMGLIVLVINLLDYPEGTVTIVYIIGLLYVLESFGVFFRSIFRAFEKMKYDAVTVIVERLLVVGAALVVLFQGHGLITVTLAMLAAQVFGFLFTMSICVGKFARPQWSFDYTLIRHLLKAALPFTLTGIFDRIIFQTDMIMLSKMQGDAVTGWYSAAQRPIFATLFIPAIVTASIFPVISRYFISSRDGLVMAYEKTLKYLVMLAIPVGIGTTLVAGRIIPFLFGDGFDNSVIVLQLLAWAVSLVFLITFTGHTLVSIDRQATAMRFSGIGALLNVVLNLSLIPSLSYTGAAIASIISVTLVLALQFGYLQKHLKKVSLFKMIAKPLAAAVVMGAVVYLLDGWLAVNAVNLLV
ncbi:flippase, partial [Chloroflexota bacterium]